MKNFIRIIAGSVLLFWSTAQAEIQFGVGVLAGQVETSGTETEGTAADTSDRSKTIKESLVGADLFIEYISDGGYTLGVNYVPMDVELGNGSRTDVSGDGSENDAGTRKAAADITDLITVYANVPVGSNGWYGLLGYHTTTVTTTETLNESSYGNTDIDGYQIGIGKRAGGVKMELAYSDFDDISLTATGGGTNTIAADADAMTFRLSYGF